MTTTILSPIMRIGIDYKQATILRPLAQTKSLVVTESGGRRITTTMDINFSISGNRVVAAAAVVVLETLGGSHRPLAGKMYFRPK